ncbi:uncharacterized protein LOC132758199 [Ruditapes philippinarum]|uniref:uncharacterized protein LOC132758199 n=1 Tax=Ruditapes philippinarum TaxID=129788 RepID=UPI00295A9D3B|nr:uncharacterized protein LOC132758199 [Ruditapes philippinarum]
MEVLIYLGILNIFLRQGASAACTLPEQFQNSVWIDSDKEELTFSTTNMTGWDFQTLGVSTVYEEWECFHTSNEGSKLYLIMIQTQNITILQETYTAYLCMELTEITSQSYYYYLLWAEEEKYREERISTTLASMSVSDPVQQLCFTTSNAAQAAAYPETGEYHILVKQGSEVAAKQECPSTFFGEYFYTVTNKDTNTDYCGTGSEVWDVCTDYEKMSFNYTICSTQISYSENGSVFCVFSLTSGSYTYHTVYNEDNTVNPSGGTHRFTCMVSSIATNGSLTVSQTPGSCKKGQTPIDQPLQAYQNTPDGLNMQLTPRSKSNSMSIKIVLGLKMF